MPNFVLQPWHLLVMSLASIINREQQQVIEYLRTENEVLKEKLGKKWTLLNDDQRRRLAVKGKVLGRKALCQVATVVSPDTILRWHRQHRGNEVGLQPSTETVGASTHSRQRERTRAQVCQRESNLGLRPHPGRSGQHRPHHFRYICT